MARLARDEQPTYILSYPRWIRLSRMGAVILLVAAALLRLVMAWVHFFRPLVHVASTSTESALTLADQLAQVLAVQPLRPLIAAHLGLFLAAGALAFVHALLPDLALTDEGLAVRALRGWQVVPWTAIQVVRIMKFEDTRQRLVLIQGNWTRWAPWPRLPSMCLGAGFQPGVPLTSSIRDFKPLMTRLYREVTQATPEALFDDEFLSPSAAMLVEPTPTLLTLVEQARDEGWPLAISAQVMTAVPAGLVIVQLLLVILQGDVWWKLLAIVGLCALEWLIGAFYLYALGEFFGSYVEFQEATLLYPPVQIPRALLTVPMAMLVASGAPFLAAMVGLAGVLWSVTLTALLVQQLYRLDSIIPAMVGGAFQALYQFMVLALIFSG
jgi:hypothetical protein